MINLYQHQKEGRDALLSHRRYCLFFGLGTGKTITALSALQQLPPSKVLIAAPKKVIEGVWKLENRIDVSQHNITMINYEKIARDKNFAKERFDVVILDEVHRLKGKSSNTSKILRVINKNAIYVWGLTGTPVANNYTDLYYIYNNMQIKEFDEPFNDFLWRYYVTRSLSIHTKFGYDTNIRLPVYPKEETLSELMSRIGKHCMVKRTEDCVELPDIRTNIVYVNGMRTKQYDEFAKGIIRTKDYEDTMTPLEALNKLHQAANGFFYDINGKVNIICENRKLKELKELLEDVLEETERVIIVYYYKQDLAELQTLNYTHTTNPSDFENKQILFLQYGQSEGLNLQYCNQIIFYTYDYSYLNFEQMCGRIYRNGQKRNVTYTILISKGTIEEKIWHAIENKESKDKYLKGVLTDGRV